MPDDASHIRSTKRILAVAAPNSGILNFLQDLTGSEVQSQNGGSTAGLSHSWDIVTPYYSATVPIWIDEIASAEEWKEEFVKPEAKEVLQVLGAWLYCFKSPVTQDDLDSIKNTLSAIAKVIRSSQGDGWDGVLLATALPQSTTPKLQLTFDEWEDTCREHGFEYVDSEATGRNEFGEVVGVHRIREALEANEWSLNDGADADDTELLDDQHDEHVSSFAAEEAEMGAELAGLKSAIQGDSSSSTRTDTDDMAQQVDNLGKLMGSLQAIKEQGSTMPETERKRFAAKAVEDLMKKI